MTVTVDVTLSSGTSLTIRRLGLFEIQDNLGRPNLEPYTIEGEINGKKYRQVYVLDYERPKPTKPLDECEHGSREYWDWLEWHNWQDGLVYERQRINAYADYCYKVADYIRRNAVIGALPDSLTTEDWDTITTAALCHTVTPDDVDKAIEQLAATYEGTPLNEAYQGVAKSGLSYDYRVVELDLMTTLGESEEIYFSRSVMDRARLIAKDQIKAMGQSLDHQAAMERAKVKTNG